MASFAFTRVAMQLVVAAIGCQSLNGSIKSLVKKFEEGLAEDLPKALCFALDA